MQRIDDARAGYALDLVARAAYVMEAVDPHFRPIMRGWVRANQKPRSLKWDFVFNVD
jgi:hypothetical protein